MKNARSLHRLLWTVAFLGSVAASSSARADLMLISDASDLHSIRTFDTVSKTFTSFITDPGLDGARGMVFNGAGRLYVAGLGSQQVRVYDSVTGAFIRSFPNSGQILYPNDMVMTSGGNLLVASYASNAIERIDVTTGAVTTFASGNGLNGPTGMAIDPTTGAVYVSSSLGKVTGSGQQYSILKYDAAGNFLRSYDYATNLLNQPADIVLSADGKTLYAADFPNGPGKFVITSINTDTGFALGYGVGALDPTHPETALDGPAGLAMSGNTLYITGYRSHQILSWDTTTTFNHLTQVYAGPQSPSPLYMSLVPDGGVGVAVVPEPSSILLLGVGALGLAGLLRRQRKPR